MAHLGTLGKQPVGDVRQLRLSQFVRLSRATAPIVDKLIRMQLRSREVS